jgi:hypothetical protein
MLLKVQVLTQNVLDVLVILVILLLVLYFLVFADRTVEVLHLALFLLAFLEDFTYVDELSLWFFDLSKFCNLAL